MIKNLSSKIGLGVLTLLGLSPMVAKAAADTDLAAGLASTSAIFSDNKSNVITFYIAVGTVLVVFALALGAIYWVRRQAKGAFGGGKRR